MVHTSHDEFVIYLPVSPSGILVCFLLPLLPLSPLHSAASSHGPIRNASLKLSPDLTISGPSLLTSAACSFASQLPSFLMEPSSSSRHSRPHGSDSPSPTIRRLCLLLLFVLQNCSRPSAPAVSAAAASPSPYLVGVGSYDITGPAADVNMMGYANAEQIASGIHFRLKARAFIVAEPDPGGNGKRAVFVNLDACMASQLVTIKVLERLKAR